MDCDKLSPLSTPGRLFYPQVNDNTTFAALQEKVAQNLKDLNVEKDVICADWANQQATARLQVGWALIMRKSASSRLHYPTSLSTSVAMADPFSC